MKKILLTLVMMSLSALICNTQALAGKIEQRQTLQHKRIWQGIKYGQLTHYEARNLLYEQNKIQRIKKSFWRDGRLNRRERIHLFLWLDKADRHIYLLKHNSRRPALWQRTAYYRHKRF